MGTTPGLLGELRHLVRRRQTLTLAALIVLVPPVLGLVSLPGMALDHWLSFASMMFDSFGLLFPLLVALLTQPRLLDEWSNTYALHAWTRESARSYFARRVSAAAVLAGGVFMVAVAVSFVVARLTYTDHGYGVPLAGPVESRFPLSQLWAISPALYLVVFCIWVGVVAAATAAWCTMLTALIGNKFLALAAPLVLWTMAQFGVAVLGLEEFSLPPFRFNLTQQPVWTEFVGLVAGLFVTAVLYATIARRRYLTPGIVRT